LNFTKITRLAPFSSSQANTEIYFEHLPIQAKAVYIYDTETQKVIWSKNEHVPLPLASITKVMTAVTALDKIGRNSIVTIGSGDLSTEGTSSLEIGEKWRADDLVSLMLVESSNDAAEALGRTLGGSPAMLAMMNKRAEDQGLYDTKFGNVTGLDMSELAGAYGSAENAAKMFVDAVGRYPDIFEKTAFKSYNVTSESGIYHTATNTDIVIGNISGFIASKTGYTDLAGGNLVFTMNAGLTHHIVIAILGSTKEGRFSDAVLLSNAVIKAMADENN
jgi:D-alanyl-D-alanine carboxypeptidase